MVRMTSPREPLRSAEIIAVGSELLGSSRVDTNSLFLADKLAGLGITLRAKSVVGDRRGDLATFVRLALGRADLVILTGGLGPTDDDLTRDVVAEVLERPMTEDPAIVTGIEARFARRGLKMPEINRRQAMVPRGATVLDNPNGSAPGLLIPVGDRVVLLLPGPPREMKPMFEVVAASFLSDRAGRERFYRATILIAGRSESHIEEAIQPIYAPLANAVPPIETTILAAPGQIEVHLTALSDDQHGAERALASARDRIVAAIGHDAFSVDGRALEEIVGDLLRRSASTIAVAESCSGGLLLSRLTDVPGSSDYVLGGVVAYSNDAKTAFADVPPAVLAEHGAVSEPVASALAEGIRRRMAATIGVGVTGIAGPAGGTPQKPVGTVAMAVAGPTGTVVRTALFHGNRSMIKHYASQTALDMVRRMVLRDATVRRD
jgi:competence/damage-inducible protein CinA-like protein